MLLQPRPKVPFTLPKLAYASAQLPYADRVLALNPISYWRGNETTGTAIADATGNTPDATAANVTLNAGGSMEATLMD